MTVAHILSHSSNVGTITLAELLGKDRLSRWIDRFGFGQQDRHRLPGETPGIVLPPDELVGLDDRQRADRPRASPSRRCRWQPPTRRSRTAASGRSRTSSTASSTASGRRRAQGGSSRARDRRAAADRCCSDVVAEGTGTEAAVPGYQVAGKTGTAAEAGPAGGYSTRSTSRRSSGFVPATKPRLVILVTVDEPQGAIWGGSSRRRRSADREFDLQYLEVPPDDAAARVRRERPRYAPAATRR